MKKGDMLLSLWRIPLDIISVIAAWFLAYFIRPYTDLIPGVQRYFPIENLPSLPFFLIFTIASAFTFVLLLACLGRYRFHEHFEPVREFFSLLFASFLWGMLIVAWYALFWHELIFSRIMLFHTIALIVLFSFCFRLLLRRIQVWNWRRGKNRKQIILFGSEQSTTAVAKTLSENLQFKIVHTFSHTELSSLENMEYAADELWRCDSHVEEDIEKKLQEICNEKLLYFRFIPQENSLSFARLELSIINETPLVLALPSAPTYWQMVVKRFFDICVSLVALIIFSPLFLIFSLCIKCDSKGPVFFKSKRVGRQGKLFTMWKFRSMMENAEQKKDTLVSESHRQDGPLFKVKNDPRITKFGHFLRRFSLDELPNFINVLKGDMSLVGPRPHLEEEVSKYETWQKRVLMMKPGITGLAQTSGRSDLPFEEEVRLDLFYFKNWSFWLDIKILLRTIGVVFSKEGAD